MTGFTFFVDQILFRYKYFLCDLVTSGETVMPVFEYEEQVEELIEEVRGYGFAWSHEISYENISEDEDFLYLELEASDDIRDQFMELGNFLDARSTGEVNGGERYILSIEKEKLA